MLYKDLVNFEKITDIIQLKEADKRQKAEHLVKTYVISEGMAEKITKLIFTNLQFENQLNNKGLFIVGNYGTGKSHLMSALSAVAEDKSFIALLNSDTVKKEAPSVGGKFKVIRAEIGSTKRDLRDTICDILTGKLKEMGIDFTFPPYEKVNNHKDLFAELMGIFNEKYPEEGLLLIIDELLDYLRTRKDQSLMLDLNFLRELGEVCAITRFRFIGGIQEALFDNPRFSFAADSLRRVKDRFEQIRIVREDIEYVISERLLKKSGQQKSLIENHLKNFCIYYPDLQTRMNRFISLFPVHPSFIDTFERIYIAEKREILKTLSYELENIMGKEVLPEEPGLISYDSYWKYIKGNPSIRSIQEIKEVMEKSDVLSKKIEQSFSKPAYKPAALRIIEGLSIHRLTTGDIYSHLGITSEELRDELFIFLKTPQADANFLNSTINVVLNEILKTVNRQFISQNQENGQYYLDLKKDIDFDAIIEQKSQGLDDDILNRYYYEILKHLTEKVNSSTYITGFNIWEHELEWQKKKITRKGYLFFCSPEQRSTTQPPRDFYIYFTAPYGKSKKIKDMGDDEIFFTLNARDKDFDHNLNLYASSMELAHSSPAGANKKIYQEKADSYRKKLTLFLSEKVLTDYSVTCKAKTMTGMEYISGGTHGSISSFSEAVDTVSSICLNDHFEQKYPHYPSFADRITCSNISQSAQEAVNFLSTGIKKKQAMNVLKAFHLLDDNENVEVKKSEYAKYFIGLLNKKPAGQVVNRSEVIDEKDSRIEADHHFKLEPEWTALILAALVHGGYIILTTESGKIDAPELTKKVNISDLVRFKHFQKPKALPLNELKCLFKLFSIPEGMITVEANQKDGLKQLIQKTEEKLKEIVKILQKLKDGLICWEINLLGNHNKHNKTLIDFKEFSETLLHYDTLPKLKNFSFTEKEIESHYASLKIIEEINKLTDMASNLFSLSGYLLSAEEKLPAGHNVREHIGKAKKEFHQDVSSGTVDLQGKWLKKMQDIKREYIEAYIGLHKKFRLDTVGDQRKQKLMKGEIFKSLRELVNVEMLDRSAFTELQNKIINLMSCFSLTSMEMERTTQCPHCKLNPSDMKDSSASVLLERYEKDVEKLYDEWIDSLCGNLSDPFVEKSIDLLAEEEKKIIRDFLSGREVPDKTGDFVKILNRVLRGLEKIEISLEDFKKSLTKSFGPCTLDELENSFRNFIQDRVKGKEKDRVRIVIL